MIARFGRGAITPVEEYGQMIAETRADAKPPPGAVSWPQRDGAAALRRALAEAARTGAVVTVHHARLWGPHIAIAGVPVTGMVVRVADGMVAFADGRVVALADVVRVEEGR